VNGVVLICDDYKITNFPYACCLVKKVEEQGQLSAPADIPVDNFIHNRD